MRAAFPQAHTKEIEHMSKRKQVQGEGNYEAAQQFNKAQRKFVSAGKVGAAARKAKPASQAEAEEMARAEEVARNHAKGEDPTIQRGTGGSGSNKP